MGDEFFDVGSKLAVPGLESTMEYGDVDDMVFDRLPGVVLINDRRILEPIRVTSIDGIHATAEVADSRQPNASRHGETAGQMLYRGRTVGLTGNIDAGSIPAVRDAWNRFSSQFGTRERDLLIHPPAEVPSFINEITNSDPDDAEAVTWFASGSATDIDVIGAAGLGFNGLLTIDGGGQQGDGSVGRVSWASECDWDGEDVWITALVKLVSATSSVDAISIYMTENPGGIELQSDQVGNPAVGDWTRLAIRIASSDINLITKSIGFMIRIDAPDGDYELQFGRVGLVKLRQDDPTPIGFFGPRLAGFESEGTRGLSRSFGPCYSVNQILDVDSALVDDTGLLTQWGVDAPSMTVNQDPISTRSWRGAHTTAGYAKVTKDNNATSRTAAIGPNVFFEVAGFRVYRWFTRLKIFQKPITGTVSLAIKWYTPDFPLSLISTSNSATITSLGEGNYMIEATAPPLAYLALPSIMINGTTTALGVFEVAWADPCFVDITEFDSECFYGDGIYESPNIADQFFPSRRLIPRPFLIRSIRHATDNKSDEQQSDGKYRRSFTMGLRASDPRIYVVDERRAQIKLSGTSKFVARQALDDYTLATPTLPVPAGFTYEGNFVTHPGGSAKPYIWGRRSKAFGPPTFNSTSIQYPAGGVGIQIWDALADFGGTAPASDLNTRAYRSAESFTYENPKVILAGAPLSAENPPRYGDDYGWNWGPGLSSTAYYNSLNILLKRVSSTKWLELRWNSVRHDHIDLRYHSYVGSAPYALELWCSHDTSGTLSMTKLAGVDLTFGTMDKLPYSPALAPYYLVSWMLDNTVFWEIWSSYPSPVDFSNRLQAGSYDLSAGLISQVGSAVAGSSGYGMRISKADGVGGGVNFSEMASAPPYISYFESSDASLPPVSRSIPVIGSIDTPQQIILRGNIVDPIISISVPEFDGYPARTSVARIIGTITDLSPITIDLSGTETTVTDQFGVDRYDLLAIGSSFLPFRPGVNSVTLQAKSWGSYPAHLITSWRDALKSG